MTNTERLIEAISYAEEEDINWWEVFDSPKQARQILSKATKEVVDEYQMIQITSMKEIDVFDSCTLEETYENVLDSLIKMEKDELKRINGEVEYSREMLKEVIKYI